MCGLPAEPVDPDELTDALIAEIDRLPVAGQTSWLA
jgi:hypothetical protein